MATLKAIDTVKVFSATMARDRDTLGERVTAWIRENPDQPVMDTVVVQSSDEAFHCLSIILFCGRH
jgi:hypothetical protein